MLALSSYARPWARAAAVVAVTLGAAGALNAMRVSPMVVEMTTAGTDAVARIEVQNLNAGNLAFETRITQLDFDDKGVPSEKPADADFIVFPPQGVLPKGARQVMRLQWVGGELPMSRAYYLSVNQLPVTPDPAAGAQNAQVQIVYHMKALVTIAPKGAEPDVKAIEAHATDFQPPLTGDAKTLPPKVPGVSITMKNTGKRYAMTSTARWTVEGTGIDGKALKLVISTEDLNRVIGTGYVPAGGGVRVFELPVIRPFSAKAPIKVKFLK